MKIPDNIFTLKNFYLLLIGVLIAIILIMRSCEPKPIPPSNPDVITRIDTLWRQREDSLIYIPGITEYLPGDTVFKDVDTVAILRDYFSKVIYTDSIRIDSFGFVIIRDTITQNRIKSRTTAFNYKLPTITIKTDSIIRIKPVNQVYGGFNIMFGPPSGLTYFGPEFLLKTKKDKIFTLGAGLSNQGTVQYKVGTLWKIKLK